MKAVLLSIRPEWCKKILSGEKTVEIRKSCPAHGTPFKVYIYCTMTGSDKFFTDSLARNVDEWNLWKYPKRLGRVIGEFTCKKITGLTHVGETGNWEPASLCVMAPGSYYKPADELLEAACMSKETAEKYLKGRDGCGWHISDLKIYDKPLPLSNFIPNCRHLEVEAGCRAYREHGWSCPDQRYDLNPDGSVNMAICQRSVKRPPQSWCYVEEKDIVDLLLYSNELGKRR